MNAVSLVVVVAAVVIGAAIGWLVAARTWKARMGELDAQMRRESEVVAAQLRTELAEAEGELRLLKADREKLQLEQAEGKSLEEKIQPLKDALESVRIQAQRANVERAEADAQLREQIEGVQRGYTSLEGATRQLVAAMSSGQSRGQWGEMQLEQLLDHSGLIEGTHYKRQDTRLGASGSSRPDIVIMLPGGGEILIDAKFPFDAYWKAIEAGQTPESVLHMKKHSDDVLARAKELSGKRYSDSSSSPDFVIMFLPLESLLSSALEANGLILEETFQRNVILATPTSMLGMLRTISFGYQRQLMADNAEEIREAGAEMLNRLGAAVEHIDGMRRGLTQAVKGYNSFVGSFDSRVMTQARKMSELGVSTQRSLEAPEEISETPRETRNSPALPAVEELFLDS